MPVALGPQPVKRSDTFAHSPDPRLSPAAHHPGIQREEACRADHAAARAGCRERYASRSIFAAMMKSLRDKPLTVWVQRMTRTFPQVTVSSG